MELNDYLINLGISTGKVLVSELTQYLQSRKNTSDFTQEFSNILSVHGASIYSDKIIEFLSKNGYLIITNSYVEATKKLSISAQKTGTFKIGENTRVGTGSSYMQGGSGTSVVGSGNARIDFHDGGINFSV